MDCSVQGCSDTFEDKTRAERHTKGHFGRYILCPACGKRFKGYQVGFSVKRHVRGAGNQNGCFGKLRDLGWVDASGACVKERTPLFNLFSLGLFDHLPIHNEHYELVTG